MMRLQQLARQVEKAMRDWELYVDFRLPAGDLVLEMHPELRYHLLTDNTRLYAYGPPPDLDQVLGMPVKINPDLPRHSWRLVSIQVMGEGGAEPLTITPKDGGW